MLSFATSEVMQVCLSAISSVSLSHHTGRTSLFTTLLKQSARLISGWSYRLSDLQVGDGVLM